MRIIDKRRDYYDGSVLYSPDPVWVRSEVCFTIGDTNPFKANKDDLDTILDAWRYIPTIGSSYRLAKREMYAMVCVCGVMYIVYYTAEYLGRPQDVISSAIPSQFIIKYNKDKTDKKDHIFVNDKTLSFYFGHQRFNDKSHNNWVLEHSESKRYHDLHRLFKSPVFMITQQQSDLVLTINPILVNVGFQVVIDPWTITQTLERYVGNDLVDTPLDGFTMSDELKRDSKGMDEWSFKQRGPKARKKKKG